MGKLPPSMRFADPLAFIRPPPTSSPSPKPKIIKTPATKNNKKQQPTKPSSSASSAPPAVPQIFQSPDLPAAIATADSLLSSPSTPLPSLNTLLQSFCSTNPSPKSALSFLSHLISASRTPPDRNAFHTLLLHTLLARDRLSLPILSHVLDLMSLHRHPADPSSLDLSVRALCSASRPLDASCLVLHLAAHRDAPPDRHTYNFLLRRLAKACPLSTVYSFIEKIRQTANVIPDTVTYTILIDNVCQKRNLREATRLLKVLGKEGHKPDCYLYNSIMRAYCMLDQGSEVMEVYNKMKDDGVEPDMVTYNTLVFGLSKAGMIPQARRFLNAMAGMGHLPDVVTYTSLMNGMCRKGDPAGALKLLGEMEEKGCSPNECTYNTLLMGLARAKCLDKAMEFFRVMTAENLKLEAGAYGTMVRTLCRANKIAEAFELFDYALQSKSLSNVSAYSALESQLRHPKKAKVF